MNIEDRQVRALDLVGGDVPVEEAVRALAR